MDLERLKFLWLQKSYSFDLLLQYAKDRDTHISKFITSQVMKGNTYNQKLVVIYTAIVKPYYEQERLRNTA
jgi:hypothetical protein